MSSEMSSTKNFEGRWGHLYKLWNNIVNQDSLPQIDRWLSQEFAKNSKYGSKDRRWYSEGIFAAIRYGYFALFAEEYSKNIKKNSSLEMKDFLSYFKERYSQDVNIIKAFSTINTESFFLWIRFRYFSAKEVPDNTNFKIPEDLYTEEKKIYNSLINSLENNNNLESKMIFYSVPLYYYEHFNNRFNYSNWNAEKQNILFQSLESRPPMWIRLNNPSETENVLNELRQEGYKASIHQPGIIMLQEVKGGVFALKSFRNGLFEIQDLASQQIGQNIQVKNGQFVWDSCAGGGGKTQQIASYLNNKGVIYASDIREYKLEELKKRAKKSGFFNIRCIKWEGNTLPKFAKEIENKNGFDWVLVDAPCSSSGTWRRNPDSKYRITQNSIEELTKLQLNILQNASLGVRETGYLVYSTCSWIYEENEKIIEKFLKQNTNFIFKDQKMLGSPFENSDTMFVGILQRTY
nr:hypothetical protein GTC16762_04850 [Pigmentibacter ruber]